MIHLQLSVGITNIAEGALGAGNIPAAKVVAGVVIVGHSFRGDH